MIPLPELGLELLLGLGAALFAANAWVLIQTARAARAPRTRRGIAPPRPRSIRRVWVNLAIGLVVAVWAGLTLVAKAHA